MRFAVKVCVVDWEEAPLSFEFLKAETGSIFGIGG